MPPREFKSVQEFEVYFKKESTLILDGTEQRIQRPQEAEEQKACYSGKKGQTVKTLVISNAAKRILFLSNSWVGKVHDFRLLKEEFPPEQKWFKKFKVKVDLGYLGIAKEYECEELMLPQKKPKKAELSEAQKQANRDLASARISVEPRIGGLKRYRILSDRLRCKDFGFYNAALGVCAGLWNFYLSA